MMTAGIIYDEVQSLCETWTVPEMAPVILAFVEQNLSMLTVDNLEDMKTSLFSLIEEIDATIEMDQSGPPTSRD